MDPATSAMDKKTPVRPTHQNARLHTSDQSKDVTTKKCNSGVSRRLQQKDGDVGGCGGAKAGKGNKGGASAGGVGGRSSHRYTRNREREKETDRQVAYGSEWSHGDDEEYYHNYDSSRRSGARYCVLPGGGARGPWWDRTRGGTKHYGGGKKKQSAGKMRTTKDKLMQARCQLVVNQCKASIDEAKSLLPVGCYDAAAAAAAETRKTSCSTGDQQHVRGEQDPDAVVSWGAVEEVILHMTELTHCPICLYAPVAPQVTRCGHVYCYPCILHYLALSDEKWRCCPICYEMVVKEDLKSCVLSLHPEHRIGGAMEMTLMRRDLHSLVPAPASGGEGGPQHGLARRIPATWGKVASILDREQVALETQMASDAGAPEVCFIEQALSTVADRRATLDGDYQQQDNVDKLANQQDNLGKQSPVLDGSVHAEQIIKETIMVGSEGKVTGDRNVGGGQEKSKRRNNRRKNRNNNKAGGGGDASNTSTSACGENNHNESSLVEVLAQSPECGARRPGSSSSQESSGGEKSEASSVSSLSEALEILVLAECNVAPQGHQPAVTDNQAQASSLEYLNFDLEEEMSLSYSNDESTSSSATVAAAPTNVPNNSSNKSSAYYFYQASDGSHVYLDHLNISMLVAEYGSVERAPHTITAVILGKEYFVVDEAVRSRSKYLRHLPLCCPFETVELQLLPPLMSEATRINFKMSLSRRERNRLARAKADLKREQQLHEREKEAFDGVVFYSKVTYSASATISSNASAAVDVASTMSERDFPTIADSGVARSPDGVSSPELGASSRSSSVASAQQQPPPSFAKMVRVAAPRPRECWPSLGGPPPLAAAAPSWGTTAAAAATSSYGRCSESTEDEDSLYAPEDYRTSFSLGMGAMLLAAADAGTKGKKGKKGKKKQRNQAVAGVMENC